TLGFFSDPVLNTFLRYGEIEVARLIFHELAHQVAFAPGDSVFNESFATAVEREGLRRWLLRTAPPEQRQTLETHQRRREQFTELTMRYRDRLATVYRADTSAEVKRTAKAKALADMRQAYADLKASWGGDGSYDFWFANDLNNAKLSSLAVYTQLVPAFERLLAAESGDMRKFFTRVADLSHLSQNERLAALHGPASKPAPAVARQWAENSQALAQH
ncbi:MAG TPA: aminopeptidase, partial [Azonexus sp.]|nr:aminopeptidase [Azonexus sp.]